MTTAAQIEQFISDWVVTNWLLRFVTRCIVRSSILKYVDLYHSFGSIRMLQLRNCLLYLGIANYCDPRLHIIYDHRRPDRKIHFRLGRHGRIRAGEHAELCQWPRVAGQSSIVLRCHGSGKLDAHSPALQLRSSVGQELLKMITAGASIPLIQVRELQQMSLFAVTPELADESRRSLEEEADIQRQIAALIARQRAVAINVWQISA